MQARVLSRRDDPATSKQAARKVPLGAQQDLVLWWIKRFGPGSAQEISRAVNLAGRPDASRIYHIVARRLPELERKGLARVQQKDGRGVVRDGSRCWEVVP